MSQEVSFLTSGIPWFAWIPLSAIVLGITKDMITKVVESSQRDRERMAMIRAGMHPDAPQYAVANDPYAKPSMPAEV
jgi:hypothetical protein